MSRYLFWFAFIALSGIVSSAADYSVPPDRENIVLRPEQAQPVIFRHSIHLALDEVDCVKCHGSIAAEGTFKRCQPCHRERGVDISAEEAFHGFCRRCHLDAAGSTAPVSCEGCHSGQLPGTDKKGEPGDFPVPLGGVDQNVTG
jgi:hypothetical protein